jgi:hypothetical protein
MESHRLGGSTGGIKGLSPQGAIAIAVASSRKDHVRVVCGRDNLKSQIATSSWKVTIIG